MPFYRLLKHLLPLLLLTACATIPTPLPDHRPGAVMETLSSAVSISIHTAGRSMGGSGYLLFRRPDQLHLVVLSPFGTTMLEAFALGDRITLIYPSRSTAYVGRFDELPEKGGLQGWRLMRWVMDADPREAGQPLNGTVERTGALGSSEKVTYENGLVTAKDSASGDHVSYSSYSVVNGVPVAAELDLRNARDNRIRITLDEPEVNTHLDDAVFAPHLDGLTVMPLSAIKGL
ncbi:MAG: lipoprotein insertase outer membrane protein LolB [Desulfuromonadaceae bacterium]|nr:lipoprotein insertase outer membrane protein LolB [Desulfuromonadaceae bacterium]MDD2848530.1 lipoprotein insertase outer membrane protein LolB [Desulfuromonadaceae bacterium]MDD4131568.1 lipoprotein insertase outer membrane protein LolB [Desulfuromonadaceae bacterium]